MYICVCKAVTDSDIKRAVDDGANCMNHLQEQLEISKCCGACADAASACLDRHLSKQLDQGGLFQLDLNQAI